MSPRRLTPASALLLSLLLHLLVVGGGGIPLPGFIHSSDDVLAVRQPSRVQQVRLATRPPAPPQQSARIGKERGKTPNSARPARKSAAAPLSPPLAPASDAPPATELSDAATRPPLRDVEAAPLPTSAPYEAAPAFPVQLVAGLEARIHGLSTTLEQTWAMEGFRYTIEVKGSKLGYQGVIRSEGLVSPEGGLSPERSSLMLGGKTRSMTEHRDGILRMGKPESLQEYPLPIVPQDFASIPFHLAVTFNGTPQTLFLSSGGRLYQTRFSLVAEEVLKLPAGKLRTLHLAGERFDHDLREMVLAFDIWLAPDYLNFPVKVSGHLRGGEPVEYRVKWLEIEGRRVLGEHGAADSLGSDEAIPAWLREQGLKNP